MWRQLHSIGQSIWLQWTNEPMPIGAVRTNKRHWSDDDRIAFGVRQAKKLAGSAKQLRWLDAQMEHYAGKNDEEALNLCVEVIHQYALYSDNDEAEKLFQRALKVQRQIAAGEVGHLALNRV